MSMGILSPNALPKGRIRLMGIGLRPIAMKGMLPDVSVDIDLGNLPTAIGLFVGSGLAFVSTTLLPAELKVLGIVGGLGLAAGGVFALLKKSEDVTAPGESVAPGVEVARPAGYAMAPVDAFEAIEGKITQPPHRGTVTPIGFGEVSYTVRVLLSNPSQKAATFELELQVAEQSYVTGLAFAWPPIGPQQAGYREYVQTLSVTLEPGETKARDFRLSLTHGLRAVTADVGLTLYKRRSAGQARTLIDQIDFTVREP